MIYLGGSMRNPKIPVLANKLRALGLEVFDDWQSPGPEADDHWQAYEKSRGRSFKEALAGVHANAVFNIDLSYLDKCHTFVLVLPAGRSAHMELGYCAGRLKRTFLLMEGEPERYDIMYRFASHLCTSEDELIGELAK